MALKSTPDRYGSVARVLHWITALAIFGLLITGQMLETTDPSAGLTALSLHAPLGLSVLVLTLARLAWWGLADTRPAPLGKGLQVRAAKAAHFGFYVLMLGMGASGIAMMMLSGAGDILSGAATGPLPDFRDYLPRIPHGIGAKLMIALIVLHIGAALYHHAILKDATLKRMGMRG
ncbi:MAG: cytochrome b [Roseinatronobacter sp.]